MLGARLLRLKGLFALADRPEAPILVDGVQHVFHAPRALARWPDADHATRAVIIVEGVAARDVENLWAALTRAPRIDAPDLAAQSAGAASGRAAGVGVKTPGARPDPPRDGRNRPGTDVPRGLLIEADGRSRREAAIGDRVQRKRTTFAPDF